MPQHHRESLVIPHPMTRLCDRIGWKEFDFILLLHAHCGGILCCQWRKMGAPNWAPVSPPSTTNSTALTYEESSEARNSTAFAISSGSPQRLSGTTDEKNLSSLSDASVDKIGRASCRERVYIAVVDGSL